jgi:hypothetical protein
LENEDGSVSNVPACPIYVRHQGLILTWTFIIEGKFIRSFFVWQISGKRLFMYMTNLCQSFATYLPRIYSLYRFQSSVFLFKYTLNIFTSVESIISRIWLNKRLRNQIKKQQLSKFQSSALPPSTLSQALTTSNRRNAKMKVALLFVSKYRPTRFPCIRTQNLVNMALRHAL